MNWKNTRSSGKTLGVAPLFRRAARLNYSSPSTKVALEFGKWSFALPTTWQEPKLMFRNNGLLHHDVVIAAGLLS